MRTSIVSSLPYLFAEPTALSWISLQENLLKASNTVEAYARGLNNWLEFCSISNISFLEINRHIIASYIHHLNYVCRVANSTLRHRITIIRLFYDYLYEEKIIQLNPIHRGSWKNGGGRRGLISVQKSLPWIPNDYEWENLLIAARKTSIRNRFMMALAYDCGLRREELCSIDTLDIDPSHRLLKIKGENTKNKCGRVVPYSVITGELYISWLHERRKLSHTRGPLFLSHSSRNRAVGLTRWTWSKVVRALAKESNLPKLSTHTFRHLCLTDLARAGWDIHEIAAFAGHRNIQSTILYIHLSARDLTKKFQDSVESLHQSRLQSLFRSEGDGWEN